MERFKIACSKPCGAISIRIAPLGILLQASSNNTELSKLLVWYSGDECLAKSVFQLDACELIKIITSLELAR